MEHAFVPAAEAMPEDKFFWVPKIGEFQGMRGFAGEFPIWISGLRIIRASGAITPTENPFAHPPHTVSNP
jgi:hypothetical protein